LRPFPTFLDEFYCRANVWGQIFETEGTNLGYVAWFSEIGDYKNKKIIFLEPDPSLSSRRGRGEGDPSQKGKGRQQRQTPPRPIAENEMNPNMFPTHRRRREIDS
jgi:hypothetical protein